MCDGNRLTFMPWSCSAGTGFTVLALRYQSDDFLVPRFSIEAEDN